MYNTFIAATSLMFSLEKYQKLLMYHPDSRQLIFLLINYLINRLIVSALKHNGHLSAVALQETFSSLISVTVADMDYISVRSQPASSSHLF